MMGGVVRMMVKVLGVWEGLRDKEGTVWPNARDPLFTACGNLRTR